LRIEPPNVFISFLTTERRAHLLTVRRKLIGIVTRRHKNYFEIGKILRSFDECGQMTSK